MRVELRFFLDRDLGGRIIASALREAGWMIETANERYSAKTAEGLADADWIRDVSGESVIITSDHSIGKRPIQAEAIRFTSARVLVVNANATAVEQAAVLVLHEASISRLIVRREGPWVFGVRHEGLRAIHLLSD